MARTDPRTPWRALADCLREQLRPDDSVLDIGCSFGWVIERLQELGHFVTGWDLDEAKACAPDTVRRRIRVVDLRSPPSVPPASVVLCTETAQYLEACHADTLVKTVVAANPRLVLWSSAPPGQHWEGHVNLQPYFYWLDRFAARGYHVRGASSARLRMRMTETRAQHHHCRDNFVVMARGVNPIILTGR